MEKENNDARPMTAEDFLNLDGNEPDVFAQGPVYSDYGWSYGLVKKMLDGFANLQTSSLKEQLQKLQEENDINFSLASDYKKAFKQSQKDNTLLLEETSLLKSQLEEKDREIERLIDQCKKEGKTVVFLSKKPDGLANKSAAGWISVKERIPENNVEVLIFSDSGRSVGVYDGFCRYLKSPGFYDLQMWSDAFGYEEDKKVTHWMPLPSPPDLQEPK